jgi:hypothetical protein
MEDCHTVVRNFKPLGPGGVPMEDGVLRTFAGLYDGHNGIKAAEHANSRCSTHLLGCVRVSLCHQSILTRFLLAQLSGELIADLIASHLHAWLGRRVIKLHLQSLNSGQAPGTTLGFTAKVQEQ